MHNLPKSAIVDSSYLNTVKPDLNIVKLITREQATQWEIVAMANETKLIHCITTNNFPQHIEAIKQDFEKQWFAIKLYYTDPDSFKVCLGWYDRIDEIESLQDQKDIHRSMVKWAEAEILITETYKKKDLFKEQDLIKEIVRLAFQAWASDLHWQSEHDGSYLRIRQDWILKTILKLPHDEYDRYIGTVKFLSNLKININFVPQDGRMNFTTAMTGTPKQIDVRVSTMPGLRGENIVMRYLDGTKTILSLEQIWFRSDYLTSIKQALDKTTGMIIVTWPTGSGKTTTLYTMLSMLNEPGKKIITLEDPVEYEVPGIQQSQVNIKKWYTFEKWLEAILRQDPDVILVGEIRSVETAEIAINAALTWHLVLTTLHTNSAVEAISRLLNMGVKPHMLWPSINCIIGQRLVRSLDEHKQAVTITPEIQAELDRELASLKQYQPQLIPSREATEEQQLIPEKANPWEKMQLSSAMKTELSDWYRGRTCIAEVLTVDDDVESMILRNIPTLEILESVRSKWYTTLTEDGYIKALQGITSLDELKRVL